MNIGAIIFGAVCLMLVVGGIGYVVAVNSQQSPITDSYGNTLSPVSNGSQNLVGTITTTGNSDVIPLLLVVGAVAVCAIVFLLFLASKPH